MTATGSEAFDSLLKYMQMWMPIAPQQLTQPIFSGWSLISVTETNSSNPETERAVVAKASYGRQLGRLIDAVDALIDERPAPAPQHAAFDALHELAAEIEATKLAAARTRFARLRADLELLRTQDRDEFDRQAPALRALLNRPAADG